MSSLPERRSAVQGALLAGLLALAACGSGEDAVRPAASAPPSPTPSSPATSLVVTVAAGPQSAPVEVSLTCEPPGGDHPDPEAACADLAAQEAPLAPLPADVVCTEQYGGPQTATVRGTHRGEPVQLELARTDGCRIAQWDGVGALLRPLVPLGP